MYTKFERVPFRFITKTSLSERPLSIFLILLIHTSQERSGHHPPFSKCKRTVWIDP